MPPAYVPDAGDIVWINFDPQAGHEQAGHRPAVVLSPAAYNAKTSLMLCCPMTRQIKSYPFEVLIAGATRSAVLADQIKSLDCAGDEPSEKESYLLRNWQRSAPKSARSSASSLFLPKGKLVGRPSADLP
jgi:mRNA interferase MazF